MRAIRNCTGWNAGMQEITIFICTMMVIAWTTAIVKIPRSFGNEPSSDFEYNVRSTKNSCINYVT